MAPTRTSICCIKPIRACAQNAVFVQFFTEQQRDVNARGRDGRTVLEIINSHRLGVDYAAILQQAGASAG